VYLKGNNMNETELRNCAEGEVIVHGRTGNQYKFIRIVRLKIENEWTYGVLYKSETGEQFVRDIYAMSGFTQK